MKATIEFELDRVTDREEFMIAMRAGEYVHLLLNYGRTLTDIADNGGSIDEAIIAFNAAISRTGLIYNSDRSGEDPLL